MLSPPPPTAPHSQPSTTYSPPPRTPLLTPAAGPLPTDPHPQVSFIHGPSPPMGPYPLPPVPHSSSPTSQPPPPTAALCSLTAPQHHLSVKHLRAICHRGARAQVRQRSPSPHRSLGLAFDSGPPRPHLHPPHRPLSRCLRYTDKGHHQGTERCCEPRGQTKMVQDPLELTALLSLGTVKGA